MVGAASCRDFLFNQIAMQPVSVRCIFETAFRTDPDRYEHSHVGPPLDDAIGSISEGSGVFFRKRLRREDAS